MNTKNILFIVSGAFAGLEEIIGKRLNQQAIGFGSKKEKEKLTKSELFSSVRAEDLINYGFESEFIG